ncbi:MAG TPA: hypothetical protein VN857_03440 [Chthoniobacterales bacterium]|nr:hypothetical protein [Chthoniobacterales bacterium]
MKALYGVSISCNTIKQNQAAYDIYLAHSQRPRARSIKEPQLQELLSDTSTKERVLLISKIARLRREHKDGLIAKVIQLKKNIAQQKEVENRLRDEIISLTLNRPAR